MLPGKKDDTPVYKGNLDKVGAMSSHCFGRLFSAGLKSTVPYDYGEPTVPFFLAIAFYTMGNCLVRKEKTQKET